MPTPSAQKPQARPRRRRRIRFVVLLLVCGLLAGGAWGLSQRTVWLAAYIEGRLPAASQEETPLLLSALAKLDSAGLEALAHQLASPNDRLANGAAEVLREKVHQWRHAGGDGAAALGVAAFAHHLAARTANYNSRARFEAARLVTDMLRVDTLSAGRDGAAFLRDCETVLRAAPDTFTQPAPLAESARPREPADASAHSARPWEEVTTPNLPSAMDMALPGPGLTSLPGGEFPPQAPAPLPVAREDSLPAGEPPGPFPPLAEEQTPAPGEVVPQSYQENVAAAPQNTSESPPEDNALALDDLTGFETTALLDLLRDGQPRMVQQAKAELRRRGFAPRLLDLSEHLASPEARVRRQWAEALPGMAHVDARFWLLWLARDPSAEVRWTAVSLLASTNDPQLRRRLQQLAKSDTDPRIRALGARLANQR